MAICIVLSGEEERISIICSCLMTLIRLAIINGFTSPYKTLKKESSILFALLIM